MYRMLNCESNKLHNVSQLSYAQPNPKEHLTKSSYITNSLACTKINMTQVYQHLFSNDGNGTCRWTANFQYTFILCTLYKDCIQKNI